MRYWPILLAAACANPDPVTNRTAAPQPEGEPVTEAPGPVQPPQPTATATAMATTKAAPARRVAIGSATTKFKAGKGMESRVMNIGLVAGSLSGLVLEPGGELSFNAAVGPRTPERGYVNAPSLFMGELVESVGGGTCQVSSTLYQAALRAGLTILERSPHSRPASYVGPGMDAMVSYPDSCMAEKPDPRVCHDLRIGNQLLVPLTVVAEVGELGSDGQRPLTVSLVGDGDPPEVETKWVQSGTSDFERKNRRIPFWKDSRTRLKQAGKPGLSGFLKVRISRPGAAVEERRIWSSYKPVPEVWEVGTGWDQDRMAP